MSSAVNGLQPLNIQKPVNVQKVLLKTRCFDKL